jgi:arginine/lysine/ornithine decarboxylase
MEESLAVYGRIVCYTVNHTDAPFLTALEAVIRADSASFSTPGHKYGHGSPELVRHLMGDALLGDVPHAGGVDTTHVSLGLLRAAEMLAADAYGGDHARYLVNGSTAGNGALLLATCGSGDIVIVSRMLHKSLLAGIIFSGARPVYLVPDIEPVHNFPLDIAAGDVERALTENPTARAVVLVSPSYAGISSDLVEISAICRRSGVPLLVDEAWGPHFHFHPELPLSAMQSGADAAVSSTHKMLSALTQGSTLVARAGMIDLGRLNTAVDMLQTTSPSALIFASLDASRRQMVTEGEALLANALARAACIREKVSGIDGIDVVGSEIVADRPGAGFDPTRIIIDVHRLGLTGYEAEHILRTEHGVFVEMSDLLSVMLLVTIGDTERSVERVINAFNSLGQARSRQRHSVLTRSSGALLFGREQVMTPRHAFLSQTEIVPVGSAAGRVSAEAITPYPPGIPVVMPGERLTASVIEYIEFGIQEGMYVSGVSDSSFGTIQVIAQPDS